MFFYGPIETNQAAAGALIVKIFVNGTIQYVV